MIKIPIAFLFIFFVCHGGPTPVSGAALHVAAENGEVETVNKLLSQGVSINAKNEDGFTALHLATQHNRVQVVETLLSHGASIKIRDSNKDGDGLAALHIAAMEGHEVMVDVLLSHGANIESKSKMGANALLTASMAGRVTVVRLLLYRGAKIEATNESGSTALHVAAMAGQVPVIRTLLSHGAKIDAKEDMFEWTPLFAAIALSGSDTMPHSYGRLWTVKTLLSKKANPKHRDTKGRTALDLALEDKTGDDSVIKLLKGEDDHIYDNDSWSLTATWNSICRPLLYVAARTGSWMGIKMLLLLGADPNTKFEDDNMALHMTIQGGFLPASYFLLSNGADVDARLTEKQATPLHLSILNEADAPTSMIEVLLSFGADIEAKAKNGITPLHLAASSNAPKKAKYLLSQGCANIESTDDKGHTALHHAAGRGRLSIVNILLSRGANVEAKTKDGETALDISAGKGYHEISNILKGLPVDGEIKPGQLDSSCPADLR